MSTKISGGAPQHVPSARRSHPSVSHFKSKLNSIPDKTSINLKWITSCLLTLAEHSNPAEEERLMALLALILDAKSLRKSNTIQASDMDTERVTELFGLSFDPVRLEKNPFVLGPEPYTPPQSLSSRLDDLWLARYDPNSEATCRIAVDFVIIACNCQLRALYPEHFRDHPNQRTSHTRPSTPPTSAPGLLTVFPELELSTTIIDPKTRNLLRIAGRADWAYGYRSRSGTDNAGSFLIAIEAKRRSALMAAEAQLLTYLAIMREERKATNKKNSVVQGFYTDGLRYVFVAIENDGSVQTSTQLSIMNIAGRRTIYNWVIKMLDTAMKSTPSATPTRAGPLQDSEVENFETQVWAKAFFPGVGAPEIVVGDENMLEYDEVLVLG